MNFNAPIAFSIAYTGIVVAFMVRIYQLEAEADKQAEYHALRRALKEKVDQKIREKEGRSR